MNVTKWLIKEEKTSRKVTGQPWSEKDGGSTIMLGQTRLGQIRKYP